MQNWRELYHRLNTILILIMYICGFWEWSIAFGILGIYEVLIDNLDKKVVEDKNENKTKN